MGKKITIEYVGMVNIWLFAVIQIFLYVWNTLVSLKDKMF